MTFSVTQLPGPSFHCRAGEASAHRAWPTHWSGHVIVDVGRQVSKSCGDLIFSSHTTFMLTGVTIHLLDGRRLGLQGWIEVRSVCLHYSW